MIGACHVRLELRLINNKPADPLGGQKDGRKLNLAAENGGRTNKDVTRQRVHGDRFVSTGLPFPPLLLPAEHNVNTVSPPLFFFSRAVFERHPCNTRSFHVSVSLSASVSLPVHSGSPPACTSTRWQARSQSMWRLTCKGRRPRSRAPCRDRWTAKCRELKMPRGEPFTSVDTGNLAAERAWVSLGSKDKRG